MTWSTMNIVMAYIVMAQDLNDVVDDEQSYGLYSYGPRPQ